MSPALTEASPGIPFLSFFSPGYVSRLNIGFSGHTFSFFFLARVCPRLGTTILVEKTVITGAGQDISRRRQFTSAFSGDEIHSLRRQKIHLKRVPDVDTLKVDFIVVVRS